MASEQTTWDLLVVCDATASMGSYLRALQTSIPEILALSKLTGAFTRLGVFIYRDYSDPADDLTSFSGWNSPTLPAFLADLSPFGGGDYPEASKTALIRALQAVDASPNNHTLVLWFTDAPPHHCSVRSYANDSLEKAAFPEGATDWVRLCYMARKRGCVVMSFTPLEMDKSHASFYILLSALTKGVSMSTQIDDGGNGKTSSARLSRLVVDVILHWHMGKEYADPLLDEAIKVAVARVRYYDEDPAKSTPRLKDEGMGSKGWLPPPMLLRDGEINVGLKNIRERALNRVDVPARVAPANAVADDSISTSTTDSKNANTPSAEVTTPFSKRFASPHERAYHTLVYDTLEEVIRTNVVALTYNGVFGSLWRAVCRYDWDGSSSSTTLSPTSSTFPISNTSPASAAPTPAVSRKAHLLTLFSTSVGALKDPVQKEAMRAWLEESFDATEEIQGLVRRGVKEYATRSSSELRSGAESNTTIESKAVDPNGDGGGEEAYSGPQIHIPFDAPITLTRTKLLEVSRSCYAGVLRRLAGVMVRLEILNPDTILHPDQRTLPLHIPPLTLFRILPHLVVRGTLYPARAASIMAVLVITTGVPFLQDAAKEVLRTTRGGWLPLDGPVSHAEPPTLIPENISYEIARLLLTLPNEVLRGTLTGGEEKLYCAMRRYGLVERNVDSGVVKARVGWTPEKTRGVGDWRVACAKCGLTRSVTVMSHEKPNICGLCLSYTKDDPKSFITESETGSCWVECSSRTCRAQYVVEHVNGLNIRARCHYCRHNIPCPTLECVTCHNRVIVPQIYRTPGYAHAAKVDLTHFQCPGCAHDVFATRAIVQRDTTTRMLVEENGMRWLGLKEDYREDLFKGKSAYKLLQTHGPAVFGVDASGVGWAALADDKEKGKDAEKMKLNAKGKVKAKPDARSAGSAKTKAKAKELKPEDVVLTLEGKRILDPAQVIMQVERRVVTGEIELGSCSLCFEEMLWDKLRPACGRSGCAQRVDEGCLKEWYGSSQSGRLLTLTQLTCPFCRRKPTTKVLTRYNAPAAALGGVQEAIADHTHFYAWCLACGFAKPALERACCGGERVEAVVEFICTDCQQREREARVLMERNRRNQLERETRAQIIREVEEADRDSRRIPLGRVTPCPRCGVMIEKTHGCNHITCQCGQHFCHVCGKGFGNGHGIYSHMATYHGGNYDEDED